MNGTVLNEFSHRGFTFIAADDDFDTAGDIFLHVSALASGEDSSRYVRGARVSFEMETVTRGGEKKHQARKVTLHDEQPAKKTRGPTVASGRKGSVKFWSPLGYGFLLDSEDGEEYYSHHSSVQGGYLRDGDVVEFDVEESDGRLNAINVRVVSWERSDDVYIDKIDMGPPGWARRLVDVAESEKWNYQEKPAKDRYIILRSYLKYTFYRLDELPDHVRESDDGSTLAFNTGLVTAFQEELFAVFHPNSGVGPDWRLSGFEKASSPRLRSQFGAELPPLASYHENPSELIYDADIPLTVSVEHVPHDPERFPSSLADLTPQDLAGLVNAKAPEAVDRVRRNYKTAIPQFYRSGETGEGKMQLLLPVALLRRDNVELALAVDRLDTGVYLGRTVLTLDWAYNNARLLTRPDNDWLRP